LICTQNFGFDFFHIFVHYILASHAQMLIVHAAANVCDLVLSPDVNNSCHQFAPDVIV